MANVNKIRNFRNRVLKVFLPVLIILQACQPPRKQEKDTPPNIIFIMADDLGYGDLGCYGQELIQTPQIDKLAENGLRFTQAYAGSAVCAPSRSALMTGFHTGHTPIRGNFTVEGARAPLPDSSLTVAEALKQQGYATGLFGKWGLGEENTEGIPTRQGFDVFYGFLNQARAHLYCVDYAWRNEEKVEFRENDGDTCAVNSAEWYFEKLKSFVSENKDQPFFAYFATQLPHAELRSTPEDMKPYLTEAGESIFEETYFEGRGKYGPLDKPFATYAAMVSQLDRQVGELVRLLDELGLSENTILFFTSDNGPHKEGGYHPDAFNSAGGLKGIKRDLYEGGIRVPMIVKWPAKTKKGGQVDYPWAHWDLMPTVMELAGEQPPETLDGESVVPVLLGQNKQRSNLLYWEMHENEREGDMKAAIRDGQWKLVLNSLYDDPELYNLEEDPAETEDLSDKYPEITQKYRSLMSVERMPSKSWPVDEDQLSGTLK